MLEQNVNSSLRIGVASGEDVGVEVERSSVNAFQKKSCIFDGKTEFIGTQLMVEGFEAIE